MNRNQQKSLFTLLVLLGTSVVLFLVQNVFLPQQQASEVTTVYVAAENIPSDTLISADMFTTVNVPTDSVVEGSVLNVAEVEGQRLQGGLLQGEMLFAQRLSADTAAEGDLYIKVEPDYPVDLEDGEFVRISVQYTEETGFQIDTLFDKKQVFSSTRVLNLVEGSETTGYYLLVDKDEMEAYYTAKSTGLIIMNKYDTLTASESIPAQNSSNPDGTDTSSANTNTTKKPAATEEPEAATTNEEMTLNYAVKEGDTFESIAFDLEVEVSELKALNPGTTEVTKGQLINIPE